MARGGGEVGVEEQENRRKRRGGRKSRRKSVKKAEYQTNNVVQIK